ncbi:MAG: PhoH family protein [Spirochaetaceae bacterium]|jgi:PhoH-like ATPase|nr:PhoH family protein [Spirochaetaceae bacterium]
MTNGSDVNNENPQKCFVLDTNVLIHRPDAFLSFKGNEVVIPLWVFEELDKLKRDSAARGRSARHAIRAINDVSKHHPLSEGVKLENGGILRVGLEESHNLPDGMKAHKIDNRIIMCALKEKEKGKMVFFVSKDINARIKADVLGLRAVDYEKNKVSISSLYTGSQDGSISRDEQKIFEKQGTMSWDSPVNPNEFVLLNEKGESKRIHIGRYMGGKKALKHIPSSMEAVLGISPLNIKQRLAFDLLLDDSIPLVSMIGKAGTGKTLLALVAGLKKTLIDKEYTRVLVSRPIIPMGNDLGYLPGAKQTKMAHWMQPIFDNLELIIDSAKQQNLKSIDQLLNNKVIEIEALTYIRGRSLPKQYIIIDEAQNLTPHEVKTIVSRAGEGTKVILSGDPYQIDSPYLDEESNGLSYLIDAFQKSELSGHITLAKSERSELAEMAAELL